MGMNPSSFKFSISSGFSKKEDTDRIFSNYGSQTMSTLTSSFISLILDTRFSAFAFTLLILGNQEWIASPHMWDSLIRFRKYRLKLAENNTCALDSIFNMRFGRKIRTMKRPLHQHDTAKHCALHCGEGREATEQVGCKKQEHTSILKNCCHTQTGATRSALPAYRSPPATPSSIRTNRD